MSPIAPGRRPGPRPHGSALRYAVVWLAAGVVASLAVIAIVRAVGGEPATVELEPIHQASLETAAVDARCRLLGPDDARPREPPSEGPAALPALPGRYDSELSRTAVVGALRRGLIVIQHHPDTPGEPLGQLHELIDALPESSVLSANPRLPVPLAAVAWRRVLLCPATDAGALDAVRLFQGRFLGYGPDS